MADLLTGVRVWETTEDPTSPFELDGVSTSQKGLRTFVSANADGSPVTVMERHQSQDEWQVARITVTGGIPDTFVVNSVISSSNAGSQVVWTGGTRDVFVIDLHGYDDGPMLTTTGALTLDETHCFVLCNFSSDLTITLPPVADYAGKRYIIKSIGASQVTIAEDAGDSSTLEDNAGAFNTSIAFTGTGKWYEFQSDGTKWRLRSTSVAYAQKPFNIEDYGATPRAVEATPTTDSTTAIQAAIDAAEGEGGGIVTAPHAGAVYDVNAQINIKENVFVSLGRLFVTGNPTDVLQANNVNDCGVFDTQIHGTFQNGITFESVDNFFCRGNWIFGGSGQAIRVDDADRGFIHRNRVLPSSASSLDTGPEDKCAIGIWVSTTNSIEIWIDHNLVRGCTQAGIATNNTTRSFISYNYVEDITGNQSNTGYGIQFYKSAVGMTNEYNEMKNNTIKNTEGLGIYCNGSIETLIEGNTLDGCVTNIVDGGSLVTASISAIPTVLYHVQRISLVVSGGAPSGNYTLTYSGQTTANIAYTANAAAVESALEALSNITDVTVVKDRNHFVVTFVDPVATTPMTVDNTGATNFTAANEADPLGETTLNLVIKDNIIRNSWSHGISFFGKNVTCEGNVLMDPVEDSNQTGRIRYGILARGQRFGSISNNTFINYPEEISHTSADEFNVRLENNRSFQSESPHYLSGNALEREATLHRFQTGFAGIAKFTNGIFGNQYPLIFDHSVGTLSDADVTESVPLKLRHGQDYVPVAGEMMGFLKTGYLATPTKVGHWDGSDVGSEFKDLANAYDDNTGTTAAIAGTFAAADDYLIIGFTQTFRAAAFQMNVVNATASLFSTIEFSNGQGGWEAPLYHAGFDRDLTRARDQTEGYLNKSLSATAAETASNGAHLEWDPPEDGTWKTESAGNAPDGATASCYWVRLALSADLTANVSFKEIKVVTNIMQEIWRTGPEITEVMPSGGGGKIIQSTDTQFHLRTKSTDGGASVFGIYHDSTAVWIGTTTAHPLYLIHSNQGTPALRIDTDDTVRHVGGAMHNDIPTETVSANAATVELGDGLYHSIDLSPATGDVTITLNATFGSGSGHCQGVILITQDATARDITWVAGTNITNGKWIGTEPTWNGIGVNNFYLVRYFYNGTIIFLDGVGEESATF